MLLMLAAVVALYSPSLKAEFMLDAHYVVENNSAIKQPKLFKTIWQRGFFESYKDSFHFPLNYYRPVTTFSFALNYLWAKDSPAGYRIVNVLIHAANAFLVFLLVYALFRHKALALTSMAIFVFHPVHEWVVNYVVGRSDLLQMFFGLMSLMFFVEFIQKGRSVLYVLSVVAFVLGLLSREATIILPVYIFIVALASGRGVHRAVYDSVPYFCLSGCYFLLRENFAPVATESVRGFSWASLLQWKVLIGEYYLRFLFPWSVASDFLSIFNNLWLLSIIWLLLGVMTMIYFLHHDNKFHQRPYIFGVLWLLVSAISLYPTKHMFARLGPYLSEHFLYFPSVGFSVLVAACLLTFREKLARWILSLMILGMALVTLDNNMYWTTEEALLKRVYAKEKGGRTVSYEQILMRYTDNPQMIKDYMRGVDNPFTQSLWNNRLGHLYAAQQDYPQAQQYLEKAIALNPKNWDAQNALAVVFLNLGFEAKGKKLLLATIQADPENQDAYRLLGELAYNHNHYSEAVAYFHKALFYDPDHVSLLRYVAMAYLFSKDIEQYQRTIDVIFEKKQHTQQTILFFINELSRHGFHQQARDLMEQNKPILFPNP
jgi:hypothetical protein